VFTRKINGTIPSPFGQIGLPPDTRGPIVFKICKNSLRFCGRQLSLKTVLVDGMYELGAVQR